MIAGTVIIAISLLLFAYWFRYTCKLMLSAHPAKDMTGKIAEANKLKFRTVQSQLNGSAALALPDLDKLFQSLNRDHRVITYLMKYGARYRVEGEHVECLILKVDYWLMKAIYLVTRNRYTSHAHKALREMARVLNYLTNSMGSAMNGEASPAPLHE